CGQARFPPRQRGCGPSFRNVRTERPSRWAPRFSSREGKSFLNCGAPVLRYAVPGAQVLEIRQELALHGRATMTPCSSVRRIPSLEGLRAISILFVLFAHLAGSPGFPVSRHAGQVIEFGELGVHVFFVISGFLITGLLLQEVERHGRISLGNFYLRRTLR